MAVTQAEDKKWRFPYNPPQEAPRILHHDHDILVVDKQPGLLSVPGRGEDRADCLIERLREAFPTVLLVHRLDQDTSGIMVFGLTPQAQRHLNRQFEVRQVHKTYLARVAGHLQPETGMVDQPLIADWPDRPRQKICHETGRPAQTQWQVVCRSVAETRVRLMPITGRSHQLRVHMAALGHPILGDRFYAEGAVRDDHPRLMLHAQSLRFRHPDGDGDVTYSAPVPF